MTTNQLEYFVAVAEQLNFTKAAKELYISQTAVTQQIRSLEESLGTKLFIRTKRHVELTPAGEVFLIEAKAILERVKEAVSKTNIAAAGITGTLNIGYIKGYEKTSFAKKIAAFHTAYPNISITMHRDNAMQLHKELEQENYDLILNIDFSKNEKLFHYRVQKKYPLIAALYASHPFAQKKSILRSELKNETFLFMSSSNTGYEKSDKQILGEYWEAGYVPKVAQSSTDFETILLMVGAEIGIAILPEYATRYLTTGNNIVFVPLKGDQEEINIVAEWKKENENPALVSFVDYLN